MHEETIVFDQLDCLGHGGLVEAVPAGAAVEFGGGVEEGRAAGGAPVGTVVVDVPVLTGEGRLGAVLPKDVVLLRGERLAPLLFCLLDLSRHAHRMRPGPRIFPAPEARRAYG